MLKKLLTLLAVITGLAAVPAPAEARLAASDGAQVHLASTSLRGDEFEQSTNRIPREYCGEVRNALVPRLAPALAVVEAPCVQIGGDRARE